MVTVKISDSKGNVKMVQGFDDMVTAQEWVQKNDKGFPKDYAVEYLEDNTDEVKAQAARDARVKVLADNKIAIKELKDLVKKPNLTSTEMDVILKKLLAFLFNE